MLAEEAILEIDERGEQGRAVVHRASTLACVSALAQETGEFAQARPSFAVHLVMVHARSALAVLALAALAGAAMWARVDHTQDDHGSPQELAQALPRDAARPEYAGSEACRACHESEYASWHHSYHRTMTQPATRSTIAAPWDAALPGGIVLRWRGERPEIVRLLADGGARTEPVVMTTGSHHMQIFWTHGEQRGALEAFEYAWLIEQARFVPNAATLVRPDADDAVYTWNRICVRCHAVAGNPGWNEATGTVQSEVVELGIACEACHGPAAAHAEHHRSPLQQYPDDIVQPASLEPRAASEVCAQCHAITLFDDEASWLANGSKHAAGDPIASWGHLLRHPMRDDAAIIDDVLADDPSFVVDRWWSDGMVRVTGREYNALVESPCHAGGDLSCLTCHSMHDGTRGDQLSAGMDGDAACTQCHAATSYASTAHTHHADVGCMDCHMPRTTWGLLGAIRSHQVDSPDSQIADDTGRPLACNLCHLDRSSAWSAAWLERWRGHDEAIPPGDPAAVGVLAAEAGVRALWAWHLGRPGAPAPGTRAAGARWQLGLLLEALADPYPAVREVAWQSILRLWPLAFETSVAPPTLDAGTIAGVDEAARIRAALEPSAIDHALVLRSLSARDDRRVALAE